jgi:hypothetical protein
LIKKQEFTSMEDEKLEVIDGILAVLAREIEWQEADFGETVRRNKDIVEGNTRDIIDTEDFLKNLDVDITPNSLLIDFGSNSAEYIVGTHGEEQFKEEILDEIDPEFLFARIIANQLKNLSK